MAISTPSFRITAYNNGDERYGIDSGFEDTISADMTSMLMVEKIKGLFQRSLDVLHKDLPDFDLEVFFGDANQDDEGGLFSREIKLLTLKEETKSDFIDHLNYLSETNPFPMRPITVCCTIKTR